MLFHRPISIWVPKTRVLHMLVNGPVASTKMENLSEKRQLKIRLSVWNTLVNSDAAFWVNWNSFKLLFKTVNQVDFQFEWRWTCCSYVIEDQHSYNVYLEAGFFEKEA